MTPLARFPLKHKTFDAEKFSLDVLVWRTENNLSRRKVAILLNTGPVRVQAIEVDKVTPSIYVAYNLCELMGVKLVDYMK